MTRSELRPPDHHRDIDRVRAWGRHFKRFASSLRGRLLFIVAAGLTPVALLAFLQAYVTYQRERVGMLRQLQNVAAAVVGDHEEIITGGRRILEAVVNQPAVLDPTPACAMTLRRALSRSSEYSNMARLDERGKVLCSALDLTREVDWGSTPWFRKLTESRDFVVSAPFRSEISDQVVLMEALPITAPSELFTGALTIAVRLSVLEQLPRTLGLPNDTTVRIVDRDGMPILGTEDPELPRLRVKSAIQNQLGGFTSRLKGGGVEIYAISPLAGGQIFALVSAPQTNLLGWARLDFLGRIVLPTLMLLLALAITWIGAYYLVLRWIGHLDRIGHAYASGKFDVGPDASNGAPLEFRELISLFSSMALRIQARERELLRSVERHEALVRELHHRVNNNLQIVSSLLNLHPSTADPITAQDFLNRARGRIQGFARVYQLLYESQDIGVVHLRPFVTTLCAELHGQFKERHNLVLGIDVLDRDLPSDAAVPLMLFFLEAQRAAYEHSAAANTQVDVRISLREGPGQTLIATVSNNGGMPRPSGGDYAIATALMRGFARQLGGQFESVTCENGETLLTLAFTHR